MISEWITYWNKKFILKSKLQWKTCDLHDEKWIIKMDASLVDV